VISRLESEFESTGVQEFKSSKARIVPYSVRYVRIYVRESDMYLFFSVVGRGRGRGLGLGLGFGDWLTDGHCLSRGRYHTRNKLKLSR
jgi:hypothetical protein